MLIMVIIHDVMMPECIGMMPLAASRAEREEVRARAFDKLRGACDTLRGECTDRVISNFPWTIINPYLTTTWNVSH